MKPSNHDGNLPDNHCSDVRNSGDLPDPVNLKIRRLERELAAYQALCDQAYLNGYATAAREVDQTREIPGELLDALRHGHADHHVHVPVGDHVVAVVLANDGEGRPQPRKEAKAWEAIQGTHGSVLASSQPGVDVVVRRDLPPAIGALAWRWDGQVAVVLGEAPHRRCVKRAVRCVTRSAVLLVLLPAWLASKSKLLIPHLATSAMTMSAAVTIAAAPVIIDGALEHKPPSAGEQRVDDAVWSVDGTSPVASTQGRKPSRAKEPERDADESATPAPSAAVETPAPGPVTSPPILLSSPGQVRPSSEPTATPTPVPELATPSPVATSSPPSPTETPSVGSSGGAGSPAEVVHSDSGGSDQRGGGTYSGADTGSPRRRPGYRPSSGSAGLLKSPVLHQRRQALRHEVPFPTPVPDSEDR